MAERKVINKYYPDDFDPSKIPRRRRPANGQIKVRTMLPMTLRCASCGAYLGCGTKFNARKEDAAGERYLGAIQVYRFYIRCTGCAAEIAFKTDPASSGYAVESGATACRDEPSLREETSAKRRRDDGGDAMAALEDRARDGRREMDANAALEEGRSISARLAGVTPEQLLESLNRDRTASDRDAQRQELERSDEALVKSVGFRSGSTGCVVKRIEDEDDEEEDFFEACLAKTVAGDRQARRQQTQVAVSPSLAVVSKRRRVSVASDGKAPTDLAVTPPEARAPAGEAKASNGALQVLCCSYGDGSDDDES